MKPECSARAGDVDRMLSWHVTMVKRMFIQISKNRARGFHRKGNRERLGRRPTGWQRAR
jgi:hypothetical protein